MAQNAKVANALMVFNLVGLLMSALRVTSATQFAVGEAKGWVIGYNYTAWADSKTIYVGDTLMFVYDRKYHNVVEVTKLDYDSCKSSVPPVSYEDGKSIVSVVKPGPHYYLCGFLGHCEAGQKLVITVLAAAPSPSHNTTAPPLSFAPESSPHNNTAPSSSPSPAPNSSESHSTTRFPPSKSESSHSPASSPSQRPSLSPKAAVPPASVYSHKSNAAPTQPAGSVSLVVIWAICTLIFCL